MDLVPELARLGAFGPAIKGHGCAGLGSVAGGLIMQELERGDSGLRTFASVQGSLAMTAIDLFGSEEQKSRWLPEMAQGTKLGCFALTEPGFGSNPGGLRCRARKTADGLSPQRREEMDRQRHHRRCCRGLGQSRRRIRRRLGGRRCDPRVPGGEGDARLQREVDRGQALAPGGVDRGT